MMKKDDSLNIQTNTIHTKKTDKSDNNLNDDILCEIEEDIWEDSDDGIYFIG